MQILKRKKAKIKIHIRIYSLYSDTIDQHPLLTICSNPWKGTPHWEESQLDLFPTSSNRRP